MIALRSGRPIAYPPRAAFDDFAYARDELIDLGALLTFVLGERADTLSLLKDLNTGISGWVSYQSREDERTQGALETLTRGWGTCRDFAVLFAEAARMLGFAARIVSGYLYNPNSTLTGSQARAPRMLGRKSIFPAPDGSLSIPPTGPWAAPI